MARSKNTPTSFSGRAWRLLRLALLWARKGGAFKRGLVFDLRISSAFLKRLKPRGGSSSNRIDDGHREFSFEDTPVFRFKTPSAMRLPRIPCITPAVDVDIDDDYDDDVSFFKQEDQECEDGYEECGGEGEEIVEEDGVDVRAEEFIARFYEQMKLQRQRSWIQYNEMLERSMC